MDVAVKTEVPAYNPFVSVVRTMTRSAYDMQKLRIQIGNRITASFKDKLGIGPIHGKTEKEVEKENKTLLDELRKDYRRITDGIVQEHSEEDNGLVVRRSKLPSEKKFEPAGLITHYSELLLIDNYMSTLAVEEQHFKDMGKILKNIPIFTEFLESVDGVGPARAGVIISEIDITKSQYPSSLWKLAGIDVVWVGVYTNDKGEEKILPGYEIDNWYNDPDNHGQEILAEGKYPVTFQGKGRSKLSWSLVKRSYINKDNEPDERMSITFNPFLKTKLLGVLATSFLRSGKQTVDGKKMGGARRLELAKSEGFKEEDYAGMDTDQAVIVYLRAKGHEVILEPSPYAIHYLGYKQRLENMSQHNEKTPMHKHRMALRFMIKRFLADLYKAWRELEGLPASPEYSEGVLGKVHGQAHEGNWQTPNVKGDWLHPRYRQFFKNEE